MLTIQEIKALSDQELRNELVKAKRELLALKLGVKMGQEKATHKVRALKKQVAMLKTVMNTFKKEQSNVKAAVKA